VAVSRSLAVALLFVTAFLWSLGGVLVKWVELPPLSIAGFRSAVAFFVLLAFFGRRSLDFSRPQIIGSLFYSATVILFVCATKLTTAGNAILLQYTSPVYVALLSGWLLKEKIRWPDWAAIGAVLAGMTLFFLDQLSSEGWLGNILAMITGLTFACLIVFLRKQKDASPAGSVVLGNIITALVCLPWMVRAVPQGGSGWAGVLLLGVVQLGLSYVLFSLAIKRVTAVEGVLIPVIEPIFNPLWAFLFVGETMGKWALAGGAILISAALSRSFRK